HSVHCMPIGHDPGNFTQRPAVTAATRHRVVVREVYFPDRATTECVADDGDIQARERYPAAVKPPAGRYTLRLGSLGEEVAPHLPAAEIRSISVRGARIDRQRPADAPVDAAARALVDGEPLAGLSALVGAPVDAALLELLAYDDLDDRRGVE